MDSIILFQKTIKTKDTKFKVLKANYEHVLLDVSMSRLCREKLEKEMKDREISFPVKLNLNDTDYYIKKSKYELPNGEERDLYRIIILGFVSVEQGQFENTLSLDEVKNEIYRN